ncbi:hypothetical protein SprV_1002858100 [Sparganum proliferum]
MRPVRRPQCKCPQGKLNIVLLSLPARHLRFGNDLPQRLDYLTVAAAAAAAAADENASAENCLDTIQTKALAVLGRASRHAQPALREGPPAKSLHRPPLRRRQKSSILPLPAPCATASARDAERTGGPQGYGNPRERGPQLMEGLLRHLLSARQSLTATAVLNYASPPPKLNGAIGDPDGGVELLTLGDQASSIAPPPSPTPPSPLVPSEDQHQPRPPTLSPHDTIKTVQQLSSGKAPALDAAPAEVYKHDGPKFMEHLTDLF